MPLITRVTRLSLQASYISSLVSSSLLSEQQAAAVLVIENASPGGFCGAEGLPPSLPVGWQGVGLLVYVEETLQVVDAAGCASRGAGYASHNVQGRSAQWAVPACIANLKAAGEVHGVRCRLL
jgi:hypothetical protein